MKRSHSRWCRFLVLCVGGGVLAAVAMITFHRTGTHENWWLDNDLFLERNKLNRRWEGEVTATMYARARNRPLPYFVWRWWRRHKRGFLQYRAAAGVRV